MLLTRLRGRKYNKGRKPGMTEAVAEAEPAQRRRH